MGSSMQLSVGPVALVSLLLSQLISKYGIDAQANPQEAISFAAEAALASGLLLVVFGLFNLGGLVSFISHPVMSGFTTAAATLIGLNQLKSAFGFVILVPQQGQTDYAYNYQVYTWLINHWNDETTDTGYSVRNPYAASIAFGVYFPLLFAVLFRNYLNKRFASLSQPWWVIAYNILSSILPLVAIIVAARVSYLIKNDPVYSSTEKDAFYAGKLSVIGVVKPGLDIIRIPSFQWNFTQVVLDVFPLTLIAFMESYSVAHRIATQKNQLYLLNASQELWAVGCGNFLASISSGFPVAGSFSRSSLNATAGARTPLSKVVTVMIVVLSLAVLTGAFVFIPNAALAAIVWVSIASLISLSDFWNAWKHTKKDFLVMLVTFVIVFVFDTAIGLAAGLGTSFLLFLIDYIFSIQTGAVIVEENELESSGVVLHVMLRNNLNFLTAGRFEEFLSSLLDHKDTIRPDRLDSTWNERAFYTVTNTLDKLLLRNHHGADHHSTHPKVLVLDMKWVRLIDLTALIAIEEMARSVRSQGCLVIVINANNMIAKMLRKYGLYNDHLLEVMDHDHAHYYYSLVGEIILFRAVDTQQMVTTLDEETGLVNNNRHEMELRGTNYAEEEVKEMIVEMKQMEQKEKESDEKANEV